MSIKEIPTNFRVYYKSMMDTIRPKYEKEVERYETLIVEEKALYDEIKSIHDVIKANYNFDVMKYKEFVDNKNTTGTFYNHAKGLFINKKENYKAVTSLYKLYTLARKQKELVEVKHQLDIWEKMLDLTLNEYKDILQTFYNEVTRQMIVEGKGYVFEPPMGWICINRCKVVQGKRRIIDFQKTKAKKEQLLNEGKRLYNREEANYAARLGLEYKGEDYRVFKNDEYVYEFALVNCKVTGESMEFKPVDSHRLLLNEKSEDDFIEECNRDINKICGLSLSIRRKLYMCLKADNILYLNFIRNEGQQSVKTPKANRKSGQ